VLEECSVPVPLSEPPLTGSSETGTTTGGTLGGRAVEGEMGGKTAAVIGAIVIVVRGSSGQPHKDRNSGNKRKSSLQASVGICPEVPKNSNREHETSVHPWALASALYSGGIGIWAEGLPTINPAGQ
jgi:hypothetical protein